MSWMALGGTTYGVNKHGSATINGMSRQDLSRNPKKLRLYGAALGANKLDTLKMVDLKAFCKAAGVVQSGQKDVVVGRLMAQRFPVPGGDALSILELLATKKAVLLGWCSSYGAKLTGNIQDLVLRVVASSTAGKVASAATQASSAPPTAKKAKTTAVNWAEAVSTEIPLPAPRPALGNLEGT